ncbi:FtsX-like permease family protein [soil metagenome]|jgi:putative ABC transport system permease protein
MMFKHLFKMIWNKKKQNFLLISEMLISFMVIFAVSTLTVYYYNNYNKPRGFDYEKVWVINYNNAVKTNNTDSLVMFYENIRKNIQSMPQVQAVSFSSENIPFAFNTNQTGIDYKKKHVNGVNQYLVEDGYKEVLNVKVLQGRWFNKQDVVSTNIPVVINESLKEELFANTNPIGKILGNDMNKPKEQRKVIGVVEDMKIAGDYKPAGPGVYERVDTGAFHWIGSILIKVTPDADATFESKLYKSIAGSMKNANVEIEHLTDKRKKINSVTLAPTILLLVVACFLIINVALGLFGVLWYNINKRRAEIGLRRAVGATGRSVSGQLVNESMILATLSLIIGSFFAIQFPLLNVFGMPASIYLVALLISIMFIYGLVLVCSLYPAKQAAAIYPAVALHED